MSVIDQKTGNGAFSVSVDGAKVAVSIESDDPRTFMSARHAYDWCKSGYADLAGTMRGFSYLNACFALEDHMECAA